MSVKLRQGESQQNLELADRLDSAAIHLLRKLRREDSASGLSAPRLSAPRLSALSVIVFAGPVTMGELAAAEQVRPPTISRLVKDLERQGLVGRKTDPGDERIQRVSAHREGKATPPRGASTTGLEARRRSRPPEREGAPAASPLRRASRAPHAPGGSSGDAGPVNEVGYRRLASQASYVGRNLTPMVARMSE